MTITKQGKQLIPASPKTLMRPVRRTSPITDLNLTNLIATQQHMRGKGKTTNRFAPLTPEEDNMDIESEPPTVLSSTQPASPDTPRTSTPTPSRPQCPTTPPSLTQNTTPTLPRQEITDTPPTTQRPQTMLREASPYQTAEGRGNTPSPSNNTLGLATQATQPQPQHPPATNPATHTHQTMVRITPSLQAHLAMATEHCRNTTIQAHTPHHSTFPPHTARPANGFPRTHLRHSTQLLDDMDPMVIATWDGAVTGPKLLARIFDFAANKADHDVVQEKIAAMRQIINGIDCVVRQTSTSEIKIAPPARAQDTATAPVAFLVYNIPETTHDALLHTKIWAIPNITFELFPFDPTFPTFLFLLEGFVTSDTTRIKMVVLHNWNTDTVYDEFTAITLRDPNFPADIDADNIADFIANSFARITESFSVELLNYKKPKDIPSPIFNIFATIPTRDPKTWHDIRALLENIQYLDPLNGTRKKGAIRQCQICQCVTHPKGLCPFPKLDGWVGPTANQAPPQRENNKRRTRRN